MKPLNTLASSKQNNIRIFFYLDRFDMCDFEKLWYHGLLKVHLNFKE